MLPKDDDDDDDDDDDVIELPVISSSQRGPEKPSEPQRGTYIDAQGGPERPRGAYVHMYIHREAQRGRVWIEQASWEPFFGLLELFRCLLGAHRPTIFYMFPKVGTFVFCHN